MTVTKPNQGCPPLLALPAILYAATQRQLYLLPVWFGVPNHTGHLTATCTDNTPPAGAAARMRARYGVTCPTPAPHPATLIS